MVVPQYLYERISTGEVVEVFQSMKQEHVFNGEDGTEIGEWRRVYTVPQMSVDVKLDPRNKNDFVRRTEKYTRLGDFQDKSRELSEIRAQKDGKDAVKEEFFNQYKKLTNGKPHPQSKPKRIETPQVVVDLT